MSMNKIVRIGTGQYGNVFARIKIEQKNEKQTLSICGVEGPKSNGDARGSCGQIVECVAAVKKLAPGWTAELQARFVRVWEEWHLNDMLAGCSHQRKIDTAEKIEVVSYKLTHEAHALRDKTLKEAAGAALRGEPFRPSATAKALAELDTWFQDVFTPPDADSPLSACYEVNKREMKSVGWVRPNEHPKGLLCKPCEVCGYKYGSAWLYEPLPAEVVEFLTALPDADVAPVWV